MADGLHGAAECAQIEIYEQGPIGLPIGKAAGAALISTLHDTHASQCMWSISS
jgi:hypothetical protein